MSIKSVRNFFSNPPAGYGVPVIVISGIFFLILLGIFLQFIIYRRINIFCPWLDNKTKLTEEKDSNSPTQGYECASFNDLESSTTSSNVDSSYSSSYSTRVEYFYQLIGRLHIPLQQNEIPSEENSAITDGGSTLERTLINESKHADVSSYEVKTDSSEDTGTRSLPSVTKKMSREQLAAFALGLKPEQIQQLQEKIRRKSSQNLSSVVETKSTV